jgi:hypothetical protein
LVKPHVVKFQHAGKCVIAAHDSSKTSARAVRSAHSDRSGQATQKIVIHRQSQSISFTSTTPDNAAVGGPVYTVKAAGGDSGNPVTYTGNAACTATGNTVSFQHADPCTVTAHQDGNADYHAGNATQTFGVAKGSLTVIISSKAPTDPAFGDTYSLDATSDAGIPVTLSVDPTSNTLGKACSLTGSTVSFDHAGSCKITASAGNDDYQSASQNQTVTVDKKVQNVTFTSTPPLDPRAGGSYSMSAIGGDSRNPVTFSSMTGDICTVPPGESVLTFKAVGHCVIAANQQGDGDYQQAITVTQPVDVNPQLEITAQLQPGGGNQEQILVTVNGLESGQKATLHVATDGKLERVGGPGCDCSLTGTSGGDPVSLTFQFNTNTFPHLTATFTLTVDGTAETASAQVSYPVDLQQLFGRLTEP